MWRATRIIANIPAKRRRFELGTFTPIGSLQQLRYALDTVSGPRQCRERQRDRYQHGPQSVSPTLEVLSSILRALAGSAFGKTRCNTPSPRVASILSRSMASESVPENVPTGTGWGEFVSSLAPTVD